MIHRVGFKFETMKLQVVNGKICGISLGFSHLVKMEDEFIRREKLKVIGKSTCIEIGITIIIIKVELERGTVTQQPKNSGNEEDGPLSSSTSNILLSIFKFNTFVLVCLSYISILGS